MPDTLDAAALRRLAMRYAARASDPTCSDNERSRLVTMREALLDLAANADWLAGRRVA